MVQQGTAWQAWNIFQKNGVLGILGRIPIVYCEVIAEIYRYKVGLSYSTAALSDLGSVSRGLSAGVGTTCTNIGLYRSMLVRNVPPYTESAIVVVVPVQTVRQRGKNSIIIQ